MRRMKALEADHHQADSQLCFSQAVGLEENPSVLLRLSLLVCEMGVNPAFQAEQIPAREQPTWVDAYH